MKRFLCIFVAISIIAGFTACNKESVQMTLKKVDYPKSISFEDFNGKRQVRDANHIDNAFDDSVRDFSYNSASKVLSNQTKNINYSPISVYMALALAGTGAKGTTREEIFSTLGVKGKDSEYLSKQTGNLFRQLYSDNEVGKLKIANSLWLRKDESFKRDFMDNAGANFYAALYNVDFKDENTAKLMGKWISENTNGVLKPSIILDKEQLLSMINTVYFKDEWVDRFEEKDTKSDTFYLENNKKEKCDFMNMTYRIHTFVRGKGFTSSSLSLKNSGSMMFILPDKGVSVDALLKDSDKIEEIFNTKGAEGGKVVFKIPKFSFGSDINLSETMKALGIKSAFTSDADFKGITDETAFISNIRQQTHIAIDEKGVEAAAFTELQYVGSAAPNEKVAEMILDRPFIYVILSNDGTLLFVGVCRNPVEK